MCEVESPSRLAVSSARTARLGSARMSSVSRADPPAGDAGNARTGHCAQAFEVAALAGGDQLVLQPVIETVGPTYRRMAAATWTPGTPPESMNSSKIRPDPRHQ
jgi:hypothetical protein